MSVFARIGKFVLQKSPVGQFLPGGNLFLFGDMRQPIRGRVETYLIATALERRLSFSDSIHFSVLHVGCSWRHPRRPRSSPMSWPWLNNFHANLEWNAFGR